MIIKGRALKFGDNINTDVIIPGRYLHISNPCELAVHAMEGLGKNFYHKLKNGDILVVGNYFGCGSSREQAVICLKFAGVGAIIAKSFARIFFRNAINQGMQIFEIPDATDFITEGDKLIINTENGVLKNMSTDQIFSFKKLPAFLNNIISDGGLIPHLLKTDGTI